MKKIIKSILLRFPYLNLLVRAHKSFYFSDKELRYYKSICDKNAYSIDVGVAWGAIAYWMKKYSKGVILFEPNPFFVPYIKPFFNGANDLFFQEAVSSNKMKTNLVIPKNRLGRSTIDLVNKENINQEFSNVDTVSTNTVILDDLINYKIGFIKIDVEGHELEVLKGAVILLNKYKPNLQIEIEERHHPGSFCKVFQLLEPFGYRCLALHQNKFIQINLENFNKHQIPGPDYIYNFVFTCDKNLCENLIN